MDRREKKELYRIFTTPCFDRTQAAMLIAPGWNAMNILGLDQVTKLYPDCEPPSTICNGVIGVDFLRDTPEINQLNLAFTINMTKKKLIPPHASCTRQRVLNILYRLWWKRRRSFENTNSPAGQLHLGLESAHCEILSICGALYISSWGSQNENSPTKSIRKVIPLNSCLNNERSIERITPEWFALLKRTPRGTALMRKLQNVIRYPQSTLPSSRRERLTMELSPYLYPSLENIDFPVTQRRKVGGILKEVPSSFASSEFKLCAEFPGYLKRSPFCKVSFHWAVEAINFEEDDMLGCIQSTPSIRYPLKIDVLGNFDIYLLPLYPPSNKVNDTSDLEQLASTITSERALFVQPVGFSAPLWQLDAGIRASSPEFFPSKKISTDYDDPWSTYEPFNGGGDQMMLDILVIGYKSLSGLVYSVF